MLSNEIFAGVDLFFLPAFPFCNVRPGAQMGCKGVFAPRATVMRSNRPCSGQTGRLAAGCFTIAHSTPFRPRRGIRDASVNTLPTPVSLISRNLAADLPVVAPAGNPSVTYQVAKRWLDIVGSLALILVLSPLC